MKIIARAAIGRCFMKEVVNGYKSSVLLFGGVPS